MRCLIVDQMHESTTQLLEKVGLEVDYRPEISRTEILSIIEPYEGLIIRSKTKVDTELIEAASSLRFVGRAGAGVDNLNVEKLEEKGIKILNAPEGNRNALGEHTIGLLLALLHKIVKADREVRKKQWLREDNRGVELSGKTVGLLGYGNMGQAFAQKLSSFQCEVLAYDKYKDNYTNDHCEQASLDELFERCDIFSIHVPLTAETRDMVDLNFIKSFKKDIYLINTARGEILNFKSCCQGLNSGKIRGLALDVLENEKLEKLTAEEQDCFSELAASDRVILTPHVAGWSYESYRQISEVLASKIGQFIAEKR